MISDTKPHIDSACPRWGCSQGIRPLLTCLLWRSCYGHVKPAIILLQELRECYPLSRSIAGLFEGRVSCVADCFTPLDTPRRCVRCNSILERLRVLVDLILVLPLGWQSACDT